MSSYDDTPSDTRAKQLIQDRQERLEEILDIFSDRAANVALTPEMKRELAVHITNYHRVLSRYEDESVLSDGDIPDISPIRQRLGQTTTILQGSSGRKRGTSYEEVPAVDELDYWYLEQVAGELESAAKKLGFWASPQTDVEGGSRLPNPSKLSAPPEATPDGTDVEARAEAAQFENSHFFRSLYKDVEGDRGGGAIIIVDAEDARTGVGKTGAACAMAEFCAWYFGYDLREDDGVLSGQQYLNLFSEHPNEEQVSVCVWDEAVGAGSGDARRAMAQENVDLGRAWQIMRDRRVITFVTLPDWGDLDSRLQKLADYRVWCRRDIGSLQAYEIGTTFEGGDIRTRGLGPGEGAEPIAFPDVTDDSALYEAIKAKKDKVQESDSLDAGELAERDGEADEETTDRTQYQDIADEVADSIDQFTSVNSTNKMEYVDQDLIQMEYDLSRSDARKVKKLVERREAAP